MEEYEITPGLETAEDMLWFDPLPDSLQALHSNDDAPFYPGTINAIHDLQWIPSLDNLNNLHQNTTQDGLSESYEAPAVHELQFDNDNLLNYPIEPELDQTTANLLMYDQSAEELTHSYYPDLGHFFISSPNPSTVGETLSPLSEPIFPSSPASPMGLFGSMQVPLPPEPYSSVYRLVELHTGFIPSLGDTRSVPKVRSREPQRRRQRGPIQKVGCSRLSAREHRKKERPEACEYCPHRFAYPADLTKHVNARHRVPEEKPKHFCRESGCSKVYTRSDRLYRHGVDKHRWPPGGDRKSSRGENGGHKN